jgi:phosphatidylserine synthase
MIIAVATAVFYRVGKRLIRVALLMITAPSLVVLAWMSIQGGRGYMAVFVFAVVSMVVLLSLALFDLKTNKEEPTEYVHGLTDTTTLPKSAE